MSRPSGVSRPAVAGVTLLHVGSDMAGIAAGHQGFAAQLHHLPVTIYLIPVVAACYRYGMEGGMLTGIGCAILTLPTMIIWHAQSFAWLGELVFLLTVVAIGLVIAAPVERARAQRQRAEAVGHRLAVLYDAAATLSDTPHLSQAIERSLAQLVSTLGLRGAAVVATNTGGDDPLFVINSASPADRLILEALADGPPSVSSDEVWVVPMTVHGRQIGHLAALGTITAEEDAILSAVADQIGVAVDNAGLHRQEERRLRSYAHRVTRAQEEERHRIARELHDDAVQQLVVLAREFDILIQDYPEPADTERLRMCRERTSEILTGLRRFSRNLRPAVLDELGLVPALEWLANDLRDRAGIDTTFEIHGPAQRLPEDLEVALFRIVQEALRNAERHASATSVAVAARFTSTEVDVSVADNGVGLAMLNTDEGPLPTHFGILGMEERARLAGGELRITSRPGAGTRIAACVPIGPSLVAEAARAEAALPGEVASGGAV